VKRDLKHTDHRSVLKENLVWLPNIKFLIVL